MARICIDARPAVWARGTGIGNYTFQLITLLGELDRENEYYLLWPDDNTPLPPAPENFRFQPMTKNRNTERQELPRWLHKMRIDLYHVPQNGFHAFPSDSCRLVVTIHDLIPFIMPETVRRGYRRRFLEKVPKVAQEAAAILTVSYSARRDIENILEVPKTKIHVTHPAPEAIFRPGNRLRAKQQLYARYGIMHNYVLYMGGLNPRKNVTELIYAFAKARKYLSGERLLVIPGAVSAEGQRLSALCRGLDLEEYVCFPGFVPMEDIAMFYAGADLFVYPSLYEGFGLPPLEAMACGIPTASSPVPSVTETAPDAALIFHPMDTTALTIQLIRGLEDNNLRHKMASRGREATARLDWQETAQQTLALYKRVLQDA